MLKRHQLYPGGRQSGRLQWGKGIQINKAIGLPWGSSKLHQQFQEMGKLLPPIQDGEGSSLLTPVPPSPPSFTPPHPCSSFPTHPIASSTGFPALMGGQCSVNMHGKALFLSTNLQQHALLSSQHWKNGLGCPASVLPATPSLATSH